MDTVAMCDLLEDLWSADNATQAYASLSKGLCDEGVSWVNYTYLDYSVESEQPGLDFWTNMPQRWMDHYNEHGMAAQDYSVRKVLSSSHYVPIITGSDFFPEMPDKRPGEPEVLLAVQDMIGMRAGFCGRLPDLQPNRCTGFMLGFNSRRRETLSLIRARGSLLALAMTGFHERMNILLRQQESPAHDRTLSDRQRDVLTGLAEGETPARIAERLRLAEATVGVHLANARRKLGARTNEQALVKAIMLGAINP
jgi:DNA-binding CsgD family transcriptional regulator